MQFTIDINQATARELTALAHLLLQLAAEQAPVQAKKAPVQAKKAPVQESEPDPQAPVQAADEAPVQAPAQVDLPMVRALLANLSRSGKKEEVQKLLADFGYEKLTQVPAEKLADIYARGSEL
jgi:hypothetical protein